MSEKKSRQRERGNLDLTPNPLWIFVLDLLAVCYCLHVTPMGCLEIVLCVVTVLHCFLSLFSIRSLRISQLCEFFTPQWKKSGHTVQLLTVLFGFMQICCCFQAPCSRFTSLSSAVMWLSLLSAGWMCGTLRLVIRTVNDRGAQRDGRGEREACWRGWGLAGDLSHTRALLQATIACVVIVLKAWRAGPCLPLWIVVLGPQLSLSELFPAFLWFFRGLCSEGEGQLKRNKEVGKHYHGTGHGWPFPYASTLPSFFVLCCPGSSRPHAQFWNLAMLRNLHPR